MKKFWLITTDHLEDRLIFKDAEDFRVGMNYVAMLAYKWRVSVLAFILMSNHLHLVLYCTREEVERFMNELKRDYSRYLSMKYGSREHLRRNGVDIRLVTTENEALERALAYVQMNCVAAGICASPRDYPWGTGACFFAGPAAGMPEAGPVKGKGVTGAGVRPLAGLSARERYRILHTKAELPGEWLVSDDGYIIPLSYVRVDYVENIFRTPHRMNYFLNSSSKAKLRLETNERSLPAFSDQVIVAALQELCRSLFQKQRFSELSEDQKVELFRQLRFRFATNVNQIARVTGSPYEVVATYLDRV